MADSIPLLDLALAQDPAQRPELLKQLRSALYEVGFLYISNHGVEQDIITRLEGMLPSLFSLPEKAKLSKMNNPHFLGYSGYAEETTLGKPDLREQFDFATELPVVYRGPGSTGSSTSCSARNNHLERDFTKLYWRLRGPNQWPTSLPGFRAALTAYHDALQELSYRFVHLIEEAFEIPVGTFDHFFGREAGAASASDPPCADHKEFLPPQHRIKLVRYPPPAPGGLEQTQGVGAHRDSSGWQALTFLYQVGEEQGLEVLSPDGLWIQANPIPGTFVVNFGHAFEAATEGAVKATIHRVIAPQAGSNIRYSIPFFQGLPLDMTVTQVRSLIPQAVKIMRKADRRGNSADVSSFLDPRWDSLGESQLRKWIRSHRDVGLKWYGKDVVDYYTT